MIVEQAGDPGHKAELLRVKIEAIPENVFCLFARKGGMAIAATGGDEVHLVVEVPMLIAVVAAVRFAFGGGAFSESAEGGHAAQYKNWSRKRPVRRGEKFEHADRSL